MSRLTDPYTLVVSRESYKEEIWKYIFCEPWLLNNYFCPLWHIVSLAPVNASVEGRSAARILDGNLGQVVIIWNRATFKLFGGDEFTYGMVTQSINMLSFIYSVIITFVIFHFYGQSIPSFDSVPKYLWGALTIGLIGSFTIQMLSTKHVEPLPDRDDRRVFEKPRMD